MNQLARVPRQPLRWSPEQDRDPAAADEPAARRAHRPSRKKERALPLAALTVIGALSVGAVAGLAFLTADREIPLPRTTGSIAAAKPAPRPAEPAATAEAKPKPSAPTVAISPAPPAPPPVLPTEPIKTASIGPTLPLSSGLAVAPAAPAPARVPETVKAPEPAAKPVEPVGKPPEVTAKAPEPPAAPPAAPARPRPTLSAAEAESLLARAEASLRAGDLSVARSFFGRLAQADDPRGALGMARTYDEGELSRLPVYGFKPDRAEADRWRARAREMTSAVARN